jgi:hypothetical protein
MITPADIRKKAIRHYEQWLERIAQGQYDYIPLVITRTGDQKKADHRWEKLKELFAQNKDSTGYGYRIELEPPAPNSKNKQSQVRSIHFDTAEDLLRYTDKREEFKQFEADCALIAAIPALDTWRSANAGVIRRHAQAWPQLLAVVRFFQENPAIMLPIRLLPIEGVDTKFLERNNGILCRLLDAVLPIKHIDQTNLSKRYGLPDTTPWIEIAWNDPTLTTLFHGFSRIAFPSDQLASHSLPVRCVLVVENRNSITQSLQTPLPDTAVIFGGGFAVALLQQATWLHKVSLYYWGDIDTHGLAILSQFRRQFPHVQALFMDEATLSEHQSAWVPAPSYKGPIPPDLTPEEAALFAYLDQTGVRLEQERLRTDWLLYSLRNDFT